MRDQRFVAEHRGGPLKKEQHVQLMEWACTCSERVLSLFGNPLDIRLKRALTVAKMWAEGKATVGEARKASQGAHAAAREVSDPAAVAVARSVGHAVATAHMADHSMGAALYALKALNLAGIPVEAERKWQNEQIPRAVKELILTNLALKGKSFKL